MTKTSPTPQSSNDSPIFFLGVPSHDAQIHTAVANVVLKATRINRVAVQFNCASLLAHNFNTLVCNAMNLIRAGTPITHFCLLHSDVVPLEDNFLGLMLAEMRQHDLAAISAVVPIKDARGLTSTGICMSSRKSCVRSHVRRLTTSETLRLPMTFTSDDLEGAIEGCPESPKLLINSGLLLLDLSVFGDHGVHPVFTINDEIVFDDEREQYVPRCEPEDWFFSRLLRAWGLRYGATRVVPVNHVGQFSYDSRQAWGFHRDPVYYPDSPSVPSGTGASEA